MMNIFVSYTTRNNEVTINSLIDFSNKLNNFGKVFIDLIDNDSEDKQKRVLSELKKSDLLILIKSSSTLESEWVVLELEIAEKLKIPIIEFSINELEDLSTLKISKKINSLK